ncbi:MAG: peptide chain release factor N(5)-glutamine methyltransferase [Desulfobacterales bacterium]|nr:peptide chain release factor N(5)-glutamine methyltransferase [Desulfobacterales bacterium]
MDWNILKLLTWTESYFKEHGVDSPRLTAEILLGHCLGIQRLDLYLQHDRPLEKEELAGFKSLIQRRRQGEPVAYITGEKGFYELDFAVKPGVLIPRPDTELLLEESLSLLKGGEGLRVLELGVGSGALIVSLAKACPDHRYFACDISDLALETARGNAEDLLDSPVHFFQSSWLTAVRPEPIFDLILSNPPYIPTRDIQDLAVDIREFEPRLALDGGEDGFDCYRLIIDAARHCLKPGGHLLMEMGFDQKPGMTTLVQSLGGFDPPVFFTDLAGHDRVVCLKK